jgi:hypothetical protein
METREMPHGIVGYEFAQALVNGEYDKAHEMLSADLKAEYPTTRLKQRYEKMASLFQLEPHTDWDWIEVMDNSDLRNEGLDAEGWAYVAIGSEAVTVTVKPFGADYLITELIWGRP